MTTTVFITDSIPNKIYQFFYFSIFPLLFPLFSTFSFGLLIFSWFRSRREKRGTSDRSQQLVFLEVRWPIEKEKKAVCIILKNKPRRARPCTSAFYHCPFFLFWNEIWLLTCPRIDTRKLIGQNLNSLLQLVKYSGLHGERSDKYNSLQQFFFKCIRNFICKDVF